MAKRYLIEETRDFPLPLPELFALLSEHENLGTLFAPAKVMRLREGLDCRNGVGSERSVRPWPLPAFVETVTDYRKNELVAYRITRGGPLRNHYATMRFSELEPGRSRVAIHISFEGRYPLIGAVMHAALRRGITKGLNEIVS